MTQAMVNQVYEKLFGESGQHFDLYEGTISSAANVRIIYLSADIIRGIHEALSYEAGEACGLILNSCGIRWGKRVATSLEKELRALANRRMDGLMVKEYCDLMESYFAFHGWGKATIDLELAASDGIVRVGFANSIFSTVLSHVQEPVDQMIEGMLQGMFESMSGGQELGCAQIIPEGAKPYALTHFLISGRARVESARDSFKPGMAVDQALQILRAA
ncbi:MAG: hypothetical protein ACRCV9_04975 [Burkholderiaceae bacterium]